MSHEIISQEFEYFRSHNNVRIEIDIKESLSVNFSQHRHEPASTESLPSAKFLARYEFPRGQRRFGVEVVKELMVDM